MLWLTEISEFDSEEPWYVTDRALRPLWDQGFDKSVNLAWLPP